MFILLFFSFSKSQILDDIIEKNSIKKGSEKTTKGKKGRKIKGLKKLVKFFSTQNYGKNYSYLFLEPTNASKPNSESEAENKSKLDETIELSQGDELLINELEKKITEIAKKIATLDHGLFETLNQSAIDFFDTMDPNRWEELASLQKKINIISKTLQDLNTRKTSEEINLQSAKQRLGFMESELEKISTRSNTLITELLEALNENNYQEEYYKYFVCRNDTLNSLKELLFASQKRTFDGILGNLKFSLEKIISEIASMEKQHSDFTKILKKRKDDIDNSINQFIVLQYLLNEETEKNTDLYKEAYANMCNFFGAMFSSVLGASGPVKDIILQEGSSSEQDQLSEKNTLGDNKIAHEFFKEMILLMGKSLEFRDNNTIFEIIKKIKIILPERDGSIYIDPLNPEGKNYETTLAAVKKAGSLQKHITDLIDQCKKYLHIESVKFVRVYENMYEYELKIQEVAEPVVFVIFIQNTNFKLSAGVMSHLKGTNECWGIISIGTITEQVLAHELAHVVDAYKNNKTISELVNSMIMELPAIFAEQVNAPLIERYSPEEILILMLFFLESETVIFEALQLNHETREFISYVLDSLGDKKELIIKNLRINSGYYINEIIVRYLKENNIKTSVGEIIDLCKDASLEDVLARYKINIKDLASLAWEVYFAKAVNN